METNFYFYFLEFASALNVNTCIYGFISVYPCEYLVYINILQQINIHITFK